MLAYLSQGALLDNRNKLCGYYLSTFDLYDSSHVQTGVERKILSQIDCFNESGLCCEHIYCSPSKSRLRRGLGSLPCITDGVCWPTDRLLSKVSYLYIRRPLFFSHEFVALLSNTRRINPAITIIVEIPTYPYDEEMKRPDLFFALKKDQRYRKQLVRHIDYIADLSGAKRIFDVPTLHIINGIDLKRTRPRRPSYSDGKEIDMVFAAQFGPWHGCDLVVRGLSDYYRTGGKRNFILHLAGDGPEIGNIEHLVDSLQLREHVVLYGPLTKVQLDDLFDRCTLAVGCFGLHRRDPNCLDSSLKTREYFAKGLPFIFAGKVDVLELNPHPFCLKFESGERAVDFFRVESFYDSIYRHHSEEEVIRSIRSYAEDNVSMGRAMSKVIGVLSKSGAIHSF